MCCIFLVRAEKAGQVWLFQSEAGSWGAGYWAQHGFLTTFRVYPSSRLSHWTSPLSPSYSLSFFFFLLLQGSPSPPPIHSMFLFFPLVFLFPLPYYVWAEWRSAICITLFIRGNFMFCVFTRKCLCHPQTIFALKEDPKLLDIHLDLTRNSLC